MVSPISSILKPLNRHHSAIVDNYFKYIIFDSKNRLSLLQNTVYCLSFPVAVPTITNPLVFIQGSSSSTMTCTSTTSIATTVTFMRDSTTVGPLRDGESVVVGGVTYELAQTVTDRTQSTYENVLTINQPLASIVGSTFTCRVQNTVGMSTPSDPLQIMGEIAITIAHCLNC